jgi:3-hydroxyacyl-CoA dehydrogenase
VQYFKAGSVGRKAGRGVYEYPEVKVDGKRTPVARAGD